MTMDSPPSPRGLSDEEAGLRQRREGYNELSQTRRRTLPRIAGEIGSEPIVLLLIAAGGLYLVLGDLGEALILLASAFITVAIAILQEHRTERALESLRALGNPHALVIRGGVRKRIPGREVVRGDVILLAEGDRVPADAVLLSANDLEIDESLLTGESVPVRKYVPGGDDLPFVFSGTMVVRGQGLGEVRSIGARSEIGKIGKTLATIADTPTPLHAETHRLVRLFAAAGIAASLAAVLLYSVTRGSWLHGLLAGITLAMSMLPEELPIVLTVLLVMGAWRIAQQRVLTRRAAAIETLGAATVLCTDKTGTLTLNRMSIAELDVGGAVWRADQDELPPGFRPLVQYGILASEPEPLDPMEQAFHALGRRFPREIGQRHREWKLVHAFAPSPRLLARSHGWQTGDHPPYVTAAKGAPEAVADLCHLDPAQSAALHHSSARMAASGLRVLGVAAASFAGEAWPASPHNSAFTFLGLVGLADPVRPSVPSAVRDLAKAGIKVVMITGDHPATAHAIAEAAGLDTAGGVITGSELAAMSDGELGRRMTDVSVFARILPEQKLRLVDAFKTKGETVAMIGDGVNDAPSLKSAHIGIAMGERGTDVAREAASMVLLADDFGAIVQAVRLGRRIYDNLRKAIGFILAVHVPIAGLSLLPLLLDWPLLFAPVHIVFLELVIDPICSIAFEAEPEESDVMERRPRDPGTPLFSARLLLGSLLQGIVVLLAIAVFFLGLLRLGFAEAEARAATFSALVIANFGLVLAHRSFDASITALGRPNRALLGLLAATLAFLAAALAIAPLRALFRFGTPQPDLLAAAIGIGMAISAVLVLMKISFSTVRRGRQCITIAS